MKPRLLMHALLVLSLGNLGCFGLVRSPSSMLEGIGRSATHGLVDGTLEGTRQCAPLKARTVGFDEEHALGGALALNWVARGGGLFGADTTPRPFASKDVREAQRELNLIGRNLAFQSERPYLPWTFGILESDGFNAISAPAGYVFVTRGLLNEVKDEAQLAGVLAHEIAHITLQHALTEYRKALHQQCMHAAMAGGMTKAATREIDRALNRSVLGLLGNDTIDFSVVTEETRAFLTGMTEGLLKTLFDRGYSAEDEFTADLVALYLMANAGYDPEAYVELLGALPESPKDPLGTAHPKKSERQQRLRKELARAQKQADDPNALLPLTTVATSRGALPRSLAAVKQAPGAGARHSSTTTP